MEGEEIREGNEREREGVREGGTCSMTLRGRRP